MKVCLWVIWHPILRFTGPLGGVVPTLATPHLRRPFQQAPRSAAGSGTCYQCGRSGHQRRDCPTLREGHHMSSVVDVPLRCLVNVLRLRAVLRRPVLVLVADQLPTCFRSATYVHDPRRLFPAGLRTGECGVLL